MGYIYLNLYLLSISALKQFTTYLIDLEFKFARFEIRMHVLKTAARLCPIPKTLKLKFGWSRMCNDSKVNVSIVDMITSAVS